MSTVTLATGIDRAARLIPFRATNLRGDYAAVCSPVATLPPELQDLQRERSATYLATGDRTAPGHAPAYYVTSNGQLIAWVSLDGRAHYTDWQTWGIRMDSPRARMMVRHQDAIRAAWDY